MKTKRTFFNMYITSTISISLVLYLLGLLFTVLFMTYKIGNDVKENVGMSIVLNDSVDVNEVQRIQDMLRAAPFTKHVEMVSKEQALNEHIEELGEDPVAFLGYNPLSASIELKLNAQYAQNDSVKMIETKLKPFQSIKRIVYHEDLIELVDRNIQMILGLLLLLAALLLLISIILINNTIQLMVYSKRFLINTMKLVGATAWVIKAPFLRKNTFVAVAAALLAMAFLAATAYYSQYSLGIVLLPKDPITLSIGAVLILLSGLLISVGASYIAVGRYVRMKTDDLYF
ncbi:MAG: permease-like cell division protein FtsX [Paludibacteraceae bacterium]|nr:permease-like cell division protein FtsX [Paludibacteraceae bacterium]MBO7233454.1 permease-like cell division protein FtsX [Paludibacteraceae bacterium]MBO7258977.1 permease-like cell division protein FtsX [Paludibacteraceae bacterium]